MWGPQPIGATIGMYDKWTVVCLAIGIAIVIVGLDDGRQLGSAVGCMVAGAHAGSWGISVARRLNADRYPCGRELEHATPSLSPFYGSAYLGSPAQLT